jgi:4-hydroxyphenylpyruvate dioxygenase
MASPELLTTNPLSCIANRFDHVEVATSDIERLEELWNRVGFARTQEKKDASGTSRLLVQGHTRVVLTLGAPGTFAAEYVAKHGDGFCSLAYSVTDAKATYETALARGAESSLAPTTTRDEWDGNAVTTTFAAIKSIGDLRATFVDRKAKLNGQEIGTFDMNAPFSAGYRPSKSPRPIENVGLLSMDHLTNNVEMGQMERWAKYYRDIFGWVETRYFDVRTDQTGINSKVLQSPDHGVRIPINQATEKKSQVQEFCDRHKGAGVQHLAITTNDIIKSVRAMKEKGFVFLDPPPDTYYEDLPKRVPGIKEDIKELQSLGILADGDDKCYMLQIFTRDQIGPFFFEVIQRRGHMGFGDGNFKALFEAVEKDQKRRGVL